MAIHTKAPGLEQFLNTANSLLDNLITGAHQPICAMTSPKPAGHCPALQGSGHPEDGRSCSVASIAFMVRPIPAAKISRFATSIHGRNSGKPKHHDRPHG